MMSQIQIVKAEDMAQSAVEMLVSAIERAISQRGEAYVALSGGTIPNQMWPILRERELEYAKIHWFWVDERVVPYEDEQSNFGVAWREWLAKQAGVKSEDLKVYPMLATMCHPELDSGSGKVIQTQSNLKRSEILNQVQDDDQSNLEDYVMAYTNQLGIVPKNQAGLPCFDLILLGMGEDGHTASLFPKNMTRDLVNEDWVIAVDNSPKPPARRLSLNYQILTAARAVMFVVGGESKAEVAHEIIGEASDRYPAGVVCKRAAQVDWLLDEESGSKL